MRIETLAVHAGHRVDPTTGAVTTPIHLSSTFERDPDGGYHSGHVYTRTSNPNRDAVEQSLMQLEGAAAAIAYASGSAATMSVFQALAPGDHVLAPDDAYFGTLRQLREIFAAWGLEADTVDMTDLDAVQRCVPPRASSGSRHRPIRSFASWTFSSSPSWRTAWVRAAWWTTPGRRRCCSSRSASAPTS